MKKPSIARFYIKTACNDCDKNDIRCPSCGYCECCPDTAVIDEDDFEAVVAVDDNGAWTTTFRKKEGR